MPKHIIEIPSELYNLGYNSYFFAQSVFKNLYPFKEINVWFGCGDYCGITYPETGTPINTTAEEEERVSLELLKKIFDELKIRYDPENVADYTEWETEDKDIIIMVFIDDYGFDAVVFHERDKYRGDIVRARRVGNSTVVSIPKKYENQLLRRVEYPGGQIFLIPVYY